MKELPTYDPNWAERFEAAHSRFDLMKLGGSPDAMRAAVDAMHQAHDAQFRTVSDYEAFLFADAKAEARVRGYELELRSVGPSGTRQDVNARYADAMEAIDRAERVRSRPPPACPEGLNAFHDPIAAGRTRHVERWHRRQTSGKSATYLVVAEYGVEAVHICVVHLGEGAVPLNFAAEFATEVYELRLAPSRAGAPPWRKRVLGQGGGYRPDEVYFYTYVPWHLHPLGHEQLWEHRLLWRRRALVEEDWRAGPGRRFETVPPALVDLDPILSYKSGVFLTWTGQQTD